MKTNIGAFDCWFRTLLFIFSISYALLAGGKVWIIAGGAGILFVTAVIAWCPIYKMFGINTYRKSNHS